MVTRFSCYARLFTIAYWLLWLAASLITFASGHPVDWSAPESKLLLIAPIPMLFTSIRFYRKHSGN
ncbi:MAG: hypothetical protein CL531_03630 [Aestuariibacter sp.]|nr:hypothetical protein [Aestuariibacter sp.]